MLYSWASVIFLVFIGLRLSISPLATMQYSGGWRVVFGFAFVLFSGETLNCFT